MQTTTNRTFVRSFRIIGTGEVVFRAWELADPDEGFYSHSTITYDDDGVCYGLVTSRLLPDGAVPEIDYSSRDRMRETMQIRQDIAREHTRGLQEEARQAIRQAVPALADINVTEYDGELIADYNDVQHLVNRYGRLL